MSVLIVYFAVDSCKPGSCTEGLECHSINGLGNVDCKPPACEANPCCENGPEPLCCQNGVCSNDNFVFNGTNANECQCLCTDNYSGLIKWQSSIDHTV